MQETAAWKSHSGNSTEGNYFFGLPHTALANSARTERLTVSGPFAPSSYDNGYLLIHAGGILNFLLGTFGAKTTHIIFFRLCTQLQYITLVGKSQAYQNKIIYCFHYISYTNFVELSVHIYYLPTGCDAISKSFWGTICICTNNSNECISISLIRTRKPEYKISPRMFQEN